MFQSFPLGDKSSVNLRGEYHTENVTTFDIPETNLEKMELDSGTNMKAEAVKESADGNANKPAEVTNSSAKGVTFSKTDPPMSAIDLYPIFWSMQQYFNQPKKLFDTANLSTFKSGLDAIMTTFRSVPIEVRTAKSADDSKKETKRRRSDDDLANSFNPKYLTSIDLFELEVGKNCYFLVTS